MPWLNKPTLYSKTITSGMPFDNCNHSIRNGKRSDRLPKKFKKKPGTDSKKWRTRSTALTTVSLTTSGKNRTTTWKSKKRFAWNWKITHLFPSKNSPNGTWPRIPFLPCKPNGNMPGQFRSRSVIACINVTGLLAMLSSRENVNTSRKYRPCRIKTWPRK